MYGIAIERFKKEKIGVVIQSNDEYDLFLNYLKDYGWSPNSIPNYDSSVNCYVCDWMDKSNFSRYPDIINGSVDAVLMVSGGTWEPITFEELFRPDIEVNEKEFINILLAK